MNFEQKIKDIEKRKIDKKNIIIEDKKGATYKFENIYLKILTFKKHKFNNFLGVLLNENIQLRNLKKIMKKIETINIETYKILEYKSKKNKGYIVGYYTAKEVPGIIYSSVKNKTTTIYIKAFENYVKILKAGIYEYDFGSNNFLITNDNRIIFIDFDECKTSFFKKKYLIKSLSIVFKNFKTECLEYNLNYDFYEKEFLEILSNELGINSLELKKQIHNYLKARAFQKKVRMKFRKIREKNKK